VSTSDCGTAENPSTIKQRLSRYCREVFREDTEYNEKEDTENSVVHVETNGRQTERERFEVFQFATASFMR
jgi:hypothetical protein